VSTLPLTALAPGEDCRHLRIEAVEVGNAPNLPPYARAHYARARRAVNTRVAVDHPHWIEAATLQSTLAVDILPERKEGPRRQVRKRGRAV
jgi:hypothetical protein